MGGEKQRAQRSESDHTRCAAMGCERQRNALWETNGLMEPSIVDTVENATHTTVPLFVFLLSYVLTLAQHKSC